MAGRMDGDANKVLQSVAKRRPPAAGMGRKKGVPNKTTKLLKDAILAAAEAAGGKDGLEGYLKAVALGKPESFMPLLGKILPTQVTGEDGGAIKYQDVTEDREHVDTLIASLAARESEGVSLQ